MKNNFTNHLANVQTTLSDRRLTADIFTYQAVTTAGTGSYNYNSVSLLYEYVGTTGGNFNRTSTPDGVYADYYTPDVVYYADYYAFGAPLQGRTGGQTYRYGFNGKEGDDEMKNIDGGSYDFGARMYDPRVGRFMSADPQAILYSFISPYSAFADNPLIFIDPTGAVLKIVFANEDEKKKVVTALQKLTNDKIEIMADGTVKLISSTQNPGKKLINGTQLLKDVINHTKTATIEINLKMVGSSSEAVSSDNARNKKGSDVKITFSQINGSAQYFDANTKKTVDEHQEDYIALGNELIHALVAMDGNSLPSTQMATNTYTNVFGSPQTETYKAEEIAIHTKAGITIPTNGKRNSYIDENAIRKEQGLKERVAYESDYFYYFKPENKEKRELFEKQQEEEKKKTKKKAPIKAHF